MADPTSADKASLDAALDGIESLCGFYERSLASETGFSVSEERFRKEIESLAFAHWPALRASAAISMRQEGAAG